MQTLMPLLNLPSPVGLHWCQFHGRRSNNQPSNPQASKGAWLRYLLTHSRNVENSLLTPFFCLCVRFFFVLASHSDEFQTALFDTGYPVYVPRPGFAEALAALSAQFGGKLKIAPYINGRIFDVGIEKWAKDKAQQFAAKQVTPGWGQKNLSLFEESYGSGSTFAVMCPATSYWSETLAEVAASLVSLGAEEALYVDQIGAARTAPCSDPSHGHTLGDGRSWVSGNNAALKLIGKAMGGPQGNRGIILTESNGESFMANVHVYLTLAATNFNASGSIGRMVPLFPAIYVRT
jgi:hypothetical protein